MNGSTPEHGRNVSCFLLERYNRSRVALGRVSKLLKGRKSFFVGEIEDLGVCLKHLEVEGSNSIEEDGILSKPRALLRSVVQDLFDGRRCFCPVSTLILFDYIDIVLNGLLTDIASCRGKITSCPEGGQFQQSRKLLA